MEAAATVSLAAIAAVGSKPLSPPPCLTVIATLLLLDTSY